MSETNKQRRPDLGLLNILVAIADAGSVSGAADRLAMSQPAVSHALRRLRDLVDDPLFERAGPRLAATPRAEAMLPTAREVVERAGALLMPNDFDPARESYGWKIGVPEYALCTLADPLLNRIQAINPRLRLEFLPVGPSTLDDILAQRMDFAFWGDIGDARSIPPIIATELFRESYVGVICASHPLADRARRGELSLDDWLGFAHVRFTSQTPGLSSIDRVLADMGRTRRFALTSPSHAWNVRALTGTTLILSLPKRLSHLTAPETHVIFPLPLEVPAYPYFVLYHVRVNTNPAQRYMRNLIREISGNPTPQQRP